MEADLSLFSTLRKRWRSDAPAITTGARAWSYGEIVERALRTSVCANDGRDGREVRRSWSLGPTPATRQGVGVAPR